MNTGLCECGCGKKTAIAAKTIRCKGYIKGQPRRFVRGHYSAPRLGLTPRENVGYSAIHKWLETYAVKTGKCAKCGTRPKTRTEWANISGEYLRDLDDYIELCVPCHRRFDLT